LSFCEPAKPDQYFYFIGFERKGNTKGEDFLDSAPSRPPPNGGGERTPSRPPPCGGGEKPPPGLPQMGEEKEPPPRMGRGRGGAVRKTQGTTE